MRMASMTLNDGLCSQRGYNDGQSCLMQNRPNKWMMGNNGFNYVNDDYSNGNSDTNDFKHGN